MRAALTCSAAALIACVSLTACSGSDSSDSSKSNTSTTSSKKVSFPEVQKHQNSHAKNDDAKAFADLNKGGSCTSIVKNVAYWYTPNKSSAGSVVCGDKDAALKAKNGVVFHLDGETWKHDKATS